MPRNGFDNFFFSYSYGPATWVSMNTEFNYSEGSAQWLWIEGALAAVDRSVSPWLFLSLHRPVYSVDNDETPSHMPGGPLSAALEPLLRKYAVDVVWQGHEHVYERTAAVFNGSVQGLPDAAGTYHSPPAPIYIVQGTSGADLDFDHWVSPMPAWNLVHDTYYGFGRMQLSTEGSVRRLAYESVDTDGKVRDSWAIEKAV
jgi:hypothetical protein